MNYTEIFREVVSIMEKDSATYPDYGAGDYGKYEKKIFDNMDRMEFLHVVQDYLATFKVYAHLNFSDKTIGEVGFSVMRYEDYLYIIRANKDTGLVAGDKITAVDMMTVPELAKKEENMLMGESSEREGMHWPSILKFYKELTVEHQDGSTENIDITLGTKAEPSNKYYFKKYGNDTLFLRLEDFADLDAIAKLYDDCRKDLDSCRNLIIDVRGNGGADSGFFPLLEYVFPAGEPVNKYFKIPYPMAINYSERNCNDRKKLLKEFFGDETPEDMKAMLDKMIADIEANYGKGLIEETDDTDFSMPGREKPEKVWVITDECCGSSGDAFVEAVSFSPKVTIIGRPTCGITDYSNCSMVKIDDYGMVYPTSRDGRIDLGKGLSQKGVPVDVYIPWSPDHLEKDAELEYVLNMC